MQVNQWWLRLVMPTETHMFWLSDDGYNDATGFQDEITAASVQLDFPEDWIDRTDGTWHRGLYCDPPQGHFNGAIMHNEGWYVPED